MNRTTRWLGLAAVVVACLLASAPRPATAGIIFDNTIGRGAPSGTSSRPQSGIVSPGTNISNVATNTVITGIGVLTRLLADQNMKFLIFDQATSALLYESAAKSFSADGNDATWKDSDPFSFTLLAGHKYFIGAVMDGSANFPYYSGTNYTQNGITSIPQNANFTEYNNPGLAGTAGADIPLRLYSDISAVPEPSSLALAVIAAVAGTGALARRRLASRRA